MVRLSGFFGLIFSAIIVCGCTVLTSDLPSDLAADGRSPDGVNYLLPKGLVTVTLVVDEKSGIFELNVSDPEFVPDASQRYFLRYRPHPTYDDKITVSMVEDGRPFVKAITADTTDKTKQIIVNLAKTVGFFAKFQAAGDQRVLAEIVVDPTNRDEVEAALVEIETEMRRYIHERCSLSKPSKDEEEALCAGFNDLLARSKDVEPLVSLSVAHAPKRDSATPTDCSVGICYRPKEPHLVAYSIAGVTKTKVIEIPNDVDPIAIDIRRAFLVQKIQTITFDNDGFLNKVTIDKDSELYAAAQIPLAVVDAIAEGLQLRINYTQQNTQIANKEAEVIRKQSELRAKQRESESKFQSAEKKRVQAEGASTYLLKQPAEEATTEATTPSNSTTTSPDTGQVDPDLKDEGTGNE